MIHLVLFMVVGLAGGLALGKLHNASRQARVLIAGLGVCAGLVLALLGNTNRPSSELFAVFQYNQLIAVALFFAVLCAFTYQTLQVLAVDDDGKVHRRVLRAADFSGAAATALFMIGLALWNIAL